MSGRPPTVSVIVPARDAAATIATQLQALASQRGAPSFEVIVVANRCADDTASIARSFDDRLDIRVIEADDDASASYARNVGARAAQGEFLLFCDADDEVSRDWVAALAHCLGSGADAAGALVQIDRSDLPDWIYRWRYDVVDGTTLRETPGAPPYVIGASLSVRADRFHSIGGFDERFRGCGGEDVDFCRRLQRAGGSLRATTAASVRYVPRKTFRRTLRQALDYRRGGAILADKEGRAVPGGFGTSLRAAIGGVVHLVVTRGERNPLVPAAHVIVEICGWFQLRSMRRLGVLPQAPPNRRFPSPRHRVDPVPTCPGHDVDPGDATSGDAGLPG